MTTARIISTRSNRYNVKKANWNRFTNLLGKTLNRHPIFSEENEQPDAQIISSRIESTLKLVCNAMIPKKTRFIRSVPWWNSEIADVRSQGMHARHDYQRTKDDHIRKNLKK